MCKTWSIKYSCGHVFNFRLSTCRGIFHTQAKPTRDPKPACWCGPCLVFRSQTSCGPCERAKIEDPLLEKVASLQLRETSTSTNEEELVRALQEQAKLQQQLEKAFPRSQQFKKFRVSEKGRRTSLLGASPLSSQVMVPDEILVEDDAEEVLRSKESAEWYDDWAQGWSAQDNLTCANADEIAEWIAGDENGADQDGDGGIPFEIKEPEPVHLAPSIRTMLDDDDDDDDDDKENINPTAAHEPKGISLHLQRRRSIAIKDTTAAPEIGKLEIDFTERIRCLETWIVISG